MKCIKAVEALQNYRRMLSIDDSVGFVPTMGALHEGHLSLIKRAKQDNKIVIVSVFVNPTQFDQADDFKNYPVNLECDTQLCESLGVDAIFAPTAADMYPLNQVFSLQSVLPLAHRFEGSARPGHFSGMLTVVMKLLQLVQPSCLYVGEKDYQQAWLIQQMVRDFFMPINVVVCPTIREESGLPLSSRHARLTTDEKPLANRVAAMIQSAASHNALDSLKKELKEMGVVVDYLERYEGRVFSAVRIGEVRLIDNISVKEKAC